MNYLKSKNFNYLFLGLNTLFIIYFFILSIFNRPHYDDLNFLCKMREMSIKEYVLDMYFSRSGRFIAYAINGIVFSLINYIKFYWVFPIFFWLLGVILSVYGILKLANLKQNFEHINLIILIYNVFVLTNIDFATFNWLCALSYYILAPAMLSLIALLLKEKSNFRQMFSIIFLSIFIGGGHEAFTPIVLIVVLTIIIYILYKNNFSFLNTLNSLIFKKSVMAFVIMFALLLIVLLAPGNYKRLEMDEFKSPDGFLNYIKGFSQAITMFFYYLFFYLPYYLIIAFIAAYSLKVETNLVLIKASKNINKFILIYVIYLMLSIFPSVYLWGGFGIQRNYTHLVYISILFFIYFFICLIIKFKDYFENKLQLFSLVGLIVLSVIIIINIFLDFKIAKTYADAVDKRVELALNRKKILSTTPLIVKPLPAPYTVDTKYILLKLIGKKSNPKPLLYYVSDVAAFSGEYNEHFKNYYQLNFDLVLAQQ